MASESSPLTTAPSHTLKTPRCSPHLKLDRGMGMRGGESLQPEVQSFGQWASVSVHLTASPILWELPLVPVDNSSNFPALGSSAQVGPGSQDLRAGKTQTSTVILGTHAV